MKRIILGILGLIVLGVVLWITIQWAANGGWPASGAVGDALPRHIEHVSPDDGEVIADVYGVCAHFNYLAGRGMGDEPKKSIRLYLDGKNVTQDIIDLAELEYPVPVGELCYRKSDPLRPGWHTAKVTYDDISGERFEYKWRFSVTVEE